MNTRKWNKLLLGTAIVTLAIGVTYACKDFLNTTPQGVLNEDALDCFRIVRGRLEACPTLHRLAGTNRAGEAVVVVPIFFVP